MGMKDPKTSISFFATTPRNLGVRGNTKLRGTVTPDMQSRIIDLVKTKLYYYHLSPHLRAYNRPT